LRCAVAMPRLLRVCTLLTGALLAVCPCASAQSDGTPATPADEAAAPEAARSVEIDQSLISLSTTMPLQAHKSYFRLTHRFARDLGQGSFGSLVDDFFSLDNGAVMGLEYRYGITSTLQAGVHRSTLGKTIETFGRWDVVRQSNRMPFAVSPAIAIEGQNNLRQDPQPGVSATLSRAQGTRLLLYATPTYVHNAHTETLRLLHEGHAHDLGTAEDPDESSTAVDTVFVGVGARLRLRETMSVTVEAAPRLGGYTPDVAVWGVGIEKLTRGHVLQLNFGNSFGTTPGMVARGGVRDEVFLGFNLSRKF
jgi:hypothetical protein